MEANIKGMQITNLLECPRGAIRAGTIMPRAIAFAPCPLDLWSVTTCEDEARATDNKYTKHALWRITIP